MREALLFLLWLIADTPVPASDDYSRRIIREGARGEIVAFVPAAVLNEVPFDNLPLDDWNKQGLIGEKTLRLVPHFPCWGAGCEIQQCRGEGYREEPGTAPNAMSIIDRARLKKVAVTGRIIEVVPGWSTRWGSIATAYYLSVEKDLKAPRSGLGAEGVLVFINPAGDFYFQGVRLCQVHASCLRDLRVGDELLVVGSPDTYYHAKYLYFPMLHRIDRGKVVYHPYATVTNREDLPLEVLEQAMKEVKP